MNTESFGFELTGQSIAGSGRLCGNTRTEKDVWIRDYGIRQVYYEKEDTCRMLKLRRQEGIY